VLAIATNIVLEKPDLIKGLVKIILKLSNVNSDGQSKTLFALNTCGGTIEIIRMCHTGKIMIKANNIKNKLMK